jgi:hypothetical protein
MEAVGIGEFADFVRVNDNRRHALAPSAPP